MAVVRICAQSHLSAGDGYSLSPMFGSRNGCSTPCPIPPVRMRHGRGVRLARLRAIRVSTLCRRLFQPGVTASLAGQRYSVMKLAIPVHSSIS